MRIVAIMMALAFFALPARAQDGWPETCKLQRQASLPFHIVHGHVQIQVLLNGVPRHFIVDTGGFLSSVTQAVVADQKLDTLPIRDDLYVSGIGGGRTMRYAVADTLTFARLQATHVHLLVTPAMADGEDGIIAPDYLRNFDLDFDFAGNTLNLFKPHACPDHVVYWNAPAASLPLTVTPAGHLRVLATLDGVEMETLLDTGSPASLIGARTADMRFKMAVDPGTLTLKGTAGASTSASAHRFDTLSLGGLTIKNPTLLVTADQGAWRSDDSDLLLGLNEMRMFHVYIAYQRHTLYLSPLPPR